MLNNNLPKPVATIRNFFKGAIAAALLVTVFSFTYAVNFAGDWKLNEGKSKLEGARFNPIGTKLSITQSETELTVARTTQGPNGEATATDKFKLDGKESQNKFFGDNVKKSTIKWSDDGKSMTINTVASFERDGTTTEIKATEVWTLTADGLLSIDYSSSSSFGEMKNTYVFNK